MSVPSYKAVLKHYTQCPQEVKNFFPHLPNLIQAFPWEVALAYQFVRVETGQNRIIYGGVVKLHRAHSEVADSMLYSLHITRQSFLTLVNTIYGHQIPANIVSSLQGAEKVRDKTVHGKGIDDVAARHAVVAVLDYAVNLNAFINNIAGFKPFGSMQGFKGAGASLPKDTTKWLLKGMGF